jgi:hypothetical protein
MARSVQTSVAIMALADELAELDDNWGDAPSGTFGHAVERRLGLRVPAACWALLKGGERSVYARTVEISATGAVLKLLDGSETRFDRAQSLELDIFVPGASRPVHAVVRSARAIGQLEALEFMTMSSADRLTLAEHLDRVVAPRPAWTEAITLPRPAGPPVSWKRFVLGLGDADRATAKRREAPNAERRRHSP